MSLTNTLLMKQVMEQYFLSLKGKRPMKGDLDLDTYNIKHAKYMIKSHPTEGIVIRNATDTAYSMIGARIISVTDYGNYGQYIVTPKVISSALKLQVTTYTEELELISPDAFLIPYTIAYGLGGIFYVPRAGDITLLSGKILDAINGALRLPDSRPASPSAGDVRYDPATDTFEIYDGASWNPH